MAILPLIKGIRGGAPKARIKKAPPRLPKELLPKPKAIKEVDRNPTAFQQTMRHEIAHFLDSANSTPEYHKLKDEMDDFKIKRDKAKSELTTRYEALNEMEDYDKKIFDISNELRDMSSTLSWAREEGGEQWSNGHGPKWQDTVQVLFGHHPSHRYHGGIKDPVE